MAASGLSPSMLLPGSGGEEGAALPQLPGMALDETIDAAELRDAA